MSVDKIENTIFSMVTTHMKAAEKRLHTQVEIRDKASITAKLEVRQVAKTSDPPFFPICITQSMFKIAK